MEIKFRVWDKTNKYMKTTNQAVSTIIKNFILNNLDKKNYVIMQYTSLKDKNGKEIYEGDIIKGEILVVKWNEVMHKDYIDNIAIPPTLVKWEKFGFMPFISWISRYLDVLELDIEVIGNIYENPELLNKEVM